MFSIQSEHMDLSNIGSQVQFQRTYIMAIDSPHFLASEVRLGVKLENKERMLKKLQVLVQ
jgi:hypothetical protein